MRLLLLGFALLAAGCDSSADEDFDGRVGFHVFDADFDGAGGQPARRYLRVETERIYSCLLPLDVEAQRSESRLMIDVRGLAETDACASALGPASFQTPLDLSDGTYAVTLRNLGRTDLYTLTVAGRSVRADAVRADVSYYITGVLYGGL